MKEVMPHLAEILSEVKNTLLTYDIFSLRSINQSMVYLLTQRNSNKQYHNST